MRASGERRIESERLREEFREEFISTARERKLVKSQSTREREKEGEGERERESVLKKENKSLER